MKSMGKGYAHGKVIWMGEHAVVYGYEAIAIPLLAAEVEATIKPSHQTTIESQIFKGKIEDFNDDIYPITTLVNALMHHFKSTPLSIVITSDIPHDAGLGSSAATASAMIAAFYDLYETKLTQDIRYNWIQMSETIAHTNPSGIDARITMSKMPIIYSKHHGIKEITLDLKLHMVIGFSGVLGQTKTAVSNIAQTYEETTTQMHIEALGNLSKNVIKYIGKKARKDIGNDMTKAHHHLMKLGVSLPIIDDMVNQALSLGALGAKLTGGGLGGCVIALASDLQNAQLIQNAWVKTTQKDTWILDLSKRII